MIGRPNNAANCRRYYLKNRERLNQKSKDYVKMHRKETTLKQKKRRKNRKALIFEHYGKECQCCGESIFEFLTIDHVERGGNQHRKTVSNGRGGDDFYRWIVKNNFPDGFQTLCFNCNTAKAYYGKCPHETS